MTTRRQFLRDAGTLTLGSLVLPQLANAGTLYPEATAYPIGIQLFTLFKSMNDDPKGTLEKVAAVGYQEVESAFNTRGGYYGYTAKEFKALVEGLGMKWRAHHAGGAPRRPRPADAAPAAGGAAPAGGRPPMDFSKMPPMLNLRDNYQQLVDQAAEGGLSYLVCSSTPVSTLAEIQQSVEVFQKTGEACKKANIAFAYHNHATEFDAVEGGKTPYELILSQTDKDLVKMELDLAWATKAGKDPVALFKEQPGRFPLWHIKDIKSDKQTITEVGNGIVDFKKAFSAAKTAGLKYIFVEQDMAADPIANITTSYTNLKKILA
ncbi:sugar phosphate isomerase/epimerase family protein [Spirosoma utsteinense]|uniref:Sugar phosphate isomerase/epimerase n=1 Tax=Spirosoma utsteinense TaxID=2585773 RepID=A0ABR6WCG1_9BACT|nr:sugar phosphate isomerase/epimerase [Spirosoma utsteinense]MBC3788237.1 sugar phosphate isomerase/epimerase [Spirosoma utsteinense]MBC3794198.1 sugar phosphate isomerase/epimerase [Spirosoma utsteinense]